MSRTTTGGAAPMARRAAASAFAGSAVEYYDFTLFATASALVLGPVFFGALGAAKGTFAALATFGVAFVARPVGAVLFGHLGDRLGRRTALVASITLMGLATFAIGALPGPATIGVAAPVLLVLLRLLQGISAGGEQAGSNALTLEHAPDGRRGVFAAWTMQGTALGTLLGKVAFVGVTLLPRDAMLAWGWRVPFLAAGPLLLVALLIRRAVDETGPLEELKARGATAAVPVREVVAGHGGAVLRAAACSLVSVGGAALNVAGLAYATSGRHVTPTTYLVVLSGTTLLALLAQPAWAHLSDRVGRRPVFVGGALGTLLALLGFFPAIASRNLLLFALVMTALTLAWSAANSVSAAFVAEMFPTRLRYTGAALGSQLGIIVVGFTPAMMAAATGPHGWGWPLAAALGATLLLLAALGGLAARETHTRALG